MKRTEPSALTRLGRALPALVLAVLLTGGALATNPPAVPVPQGAVCAGADIADEVPPLAAGKNSPDGASTPGDAPAAQAAEAVRAAEERAADVEELGYVPGQIVVMYEEDASRAERREAVEELGAEEAAPAMELDAGAVASLDIADDMTVETAVQQAQASEAVRFAVPNYVAEAFDDDAAERGVTLVSAADLAERPGDQWHLGFTGAPQAWALLADAPPAAEPVKVAVIDTGASLTHPDLAGVIDTAQSVEVVWTDQTNASSWRMRPLRGDGYTNGGADVSEFTSHGTHVSGIIAAAAGNGGVMGMASGAGTARANRLIDLVVIDAFTLLTKDGQPNATLQDIVFALEYARDNGCRVVNMSLGFPSNDPELAQFFDTFCAMLTESDDMVLVCAAGNSHSQAKNYPAASPAALGVISISERSAVGLTNTFRYPFWKGSDVLRSSFSNYGSWCDISAPGESILSTCVRGGSSNGYGYMSGTSMACPMVAATAALVRAADPDLSATAVKELLCSTATDLYVAGKDIQTGHGALNAEAAVRRALAGGTGSASGTETPRESSAPAPAATAPKPAPSPTTPQPQPRENPTPQPSAPQPPASTAKPAVKKVAAPTVKAGRRGFTVRWKKVSGNVSGYQVQYALDKKFKKAAKTKTLAKSKKSWKATKLKVKKRYYVRVRAYYKVDGQKYYGKWSSVKSVKTKK